MKRIIISNDTYDDIVRDEADDDADDPARRLTKRYKINGYMRGSHFNIIRDALYNDEYMVKLEEAGVCWSQEDLNKFKPIIAAIIRSINQFFDQQQVPKSATQLEGELELAGYTTTLWVDATIAGVERAAVFSFSELDIVVFMTADDAVKLLLSEIRPQLSHIEDCVSSDPDRLEFALDEYYRSQFHQDDIADDVTYNRFYVGDQIYPAFKDALESLHFTYDLWDPSNTPSRKAYDFIQYDKYGDWIDSVGLIDCEQLRDDLLSIYKKSKDYKDAYKQIRKYLRSNLDRYE